MMSGIRSLICFLTDKNGNILDPYDPNAISYTCFQPRNKAVRSQDLQNLGEDMDKVKLIVLIKGYISLFMDGRRISEPISFKTCKKVCLYMPEEADLLFRVRNFKAYVDDIYTECNTPVVKIKVMLSTIVRSVDETDLLIPAAGQVEYDVCGDTGKTVCVRVTRVFDKLYFANELKMEIRYEESFVEAEVYQYNAISYGIKKVYTNEDELTKYGDRGILDPQGVSYYTLYINGVVQPHINYDIKKGSLTLKTTDAPIENAPIAICFVTLKDKSGDVLPAEVYHFNTISDGIKMEFTNDDELKCFGDRGILDPSQVSFINLYINGVLQPLVNYSVEKGHLALLTSDTPLNGVPITLEFVTIKGPDGRILKAETSLYNALAHESNIYTNNDELKKYGIRGIPDPEDVSFYNLFINAVIQPSCNYTVNEGLLTLYTDAPPLKGSPVSLQFITISSAPEFDIGCVCTCYPQDPFWQHDLTGKNSFSV